MMMALVLLLSLSTPLNSAQVIVIALFYCSPKKSKLRLLCVLVQSFIEAHKNSRRNLMGWVSSF